jgi:glyoxylase-like metal-dependent hydrolase (beta-lactamase superfamily II)
MSRSIYPVFGLTLSLTVAACGSLHAQTLQSSADALNAANTKTIEYSGSGRWYQFGQAPNPTSAWPQFDVSSFKASINYANPSERVRIIRSQTVEAGRVRPAPVEQKTDQYISGSLAWNLNPPPASTKDAASTPALQPAAVEERTAEIWSTPQGFLKAALANNATSKSVNSDLEISFNIGKYRYVGNINDKDEVTRVQTWIDNPVLGDTLVETNYSDYKTFDGVKFPAHIVRTQGGYPVLDINVAAAKANVAAEFAVPQEIITAKSTPVKVQADKLANGVYYLTGGTHHSVAIEQNDHVVLVEAPLNEERSLALIAKVKEVIPNKPIKYLVNTHAHFDHAGGLRTFVDEGSTIVTHQDNKPYFEKVWTEPRTINPDKLASSKKAAQFETFTDKHVLSDANKHTVEIYPIAGNGHNDAFALIYLPAEKILVEADAYTPPAANIPPPAKPNPYTVNLYENVQKLNLDIRQIAALHGTRVTTLDDIRSVISVAAAK